MNDLRKSVRVLAESAHNCGGELQGIVLSGELFDLYLETAGCQQGVGDYQIQNIVSQTSYGRIDIRRGE